MRMGIRSLTIFSPNFSTVIPSFHFDQRSFFIAYTVYYRARQIATAKMTKSQNCFLCQLHKMTESHSFIHFTACPLRNSSVY